MSNDPTINAALFNFCSRLDDGPHSAVPREPRSVEDIAWLKEALAAVEAPDKVMRGHLRVIEQAVGRTTLLLLPPRSNLKSNDAASMAASPEPLPTVDRVLDALDYLVEELEDINMATEFCLMHGPKILLDLIKAITAGTVPAQLPVAAGGDQHTLALPALFGDVEVRTKAAMALAHATQQHPKAQELLEAYGWADVIVPLLAAEVAVLANGAESMPLHQASKGGSSAVPVKATAATVAALLHAASCMCREFDAGASTFVKRRGLDILRHILAAPAKFTSKVLRRALFLTEYFATMGVSSRALIESTCDLLLLVGAQQNLVVVSTSSGTNGAVSDAVVGSPLHLPNKEDDEGTAGVDGASDGPHQQMLEERDMLQRMAAGCLLAILQKSLESTATNNTSNKGNTKSGTNSSSPPAVQTGDAAASSVLEVLRGRRLAVYLEAVLKTQSYPPIDATSDSRAALVAALKA